MLEGILSKEELNNVNQRLKDVKSLCFDDMLNDVKNDIGDNYRCYSADSICYLKCLQNMNYILKDLMPVRLVSEETLYMSVVLASQGVDINFLFKDKSIINVCSYSGVVINCIEYINEKSRNSEDDSYYKAIQNIFIRNVLKGVEIDKLFKDSETLFPVEKAIDFIYPQIPKIYKTKDKRQSVIDYLNGVTKVINFIK